MSRPLLDGPAVRRVALVLVGVGLLAVLAGGIAFHDQLRDNRFDRGIYDWTTDNLGHRLLERLLDVTTPSLVFGLVVVVLVGALFVRNARLAAVAAVGPLLSVVLTEYVLKPLIGRKIVGYFVTGLTYPSGHETGLAAATTLLVVAVLAVTTSRQARSIAVALAVVLDALGSIALVGNGYHFATDTYAAVGLSVSVVLGTALGVDLIADRMAGRRLAAPADGARV